MRYWSIFFAIAAIITAPVSLPLLSIQSAYADTTIAPLVPNGGITKAYTGTCATGTVGTCHSEQKVISGLFVKIFQIVTLLAGILAVLFIVYNGIMYITSAGDTTKMKLARGNILSILLGIVVIVAAYSIIRFAQTLGGFTNGL